MTLGSYREEGSEAQSRRRLLGSKKKKTKIRQQGGERSNAQTLGTSQYAFCSSSSTSAHIRRKPFAKRTCGDRIQWAASRLGR